MAAGLVTYKLCDREFDCARCPLDAALRGGEHARIDGRLVPDDSRRNQGFPDDRRYAAGHTWLADGFGPDPSAIRIGLDSFAASLLPRPIRANCVPEPGGPRGDPLCDIELPAGTLSIRAPVAGRVARNNVALHDRPGLVVESPYQDGWLVDLIPAWDDATREGLQDAEQARKRTDIHLRHFRRRVALHLLTDLAAVGPCMADGGETLTSLPEILGGQQYLRLLREVLR
jgi:glycine cleavage system H protein